MVRVYGSSSESWLTGMSGSKNFLSLKLLQIRCWLDEDGTNCY